jgi:hypothetical protein
MARLSKETAERHYEKILAIHNFQYLTLAQKVSIFFHDLEHDILNEITGKKGYFDQINWLRDNQIRFEHNVRSGDIPKVNIGDIENIRNWRNEGVHEAKMPEPKYMSHFHTMAETICFFSEIPIPENINKIFINSSRNKKEKNYINTNVKSIDYIESKYEPLGKHLKQNGNNNINLSFNEIENILGFKLPDYLHKHPEGWQGTPEGSPTHRQKAVWYKYGYKVETVDLKNKNIMFCKI